MYYKTSVGQLVFVDDGLGVDQRSTEVHELQPGMTYNFRLAAVNVFGPGPPANFTVTLPGGEKSLGKWKSIGL